MSTTKKWKEKIIAGICVFSMLLGTLSCSKAVTAASEWSEWLDSSINLGEEYDVESRTVYRYRDKSTTTSKSSSMLGWTLYDSSTVWGSWSGWQDTAISASSTRQVNTRTVYRYRDKSTTTSTSSSLAGWTKYDTSTTWGSWSGWQDTAVSASSTRKVETRQVQVTAAYTQYRYGRWNNANNTYWHFCDYLAQQQRGGTWHKAYTPWMNSPLSGTYDASTCGSHGCYNQASNASQRKFQYNGQNWYWQETQVVPATYKTQYRYQDATITYYYYKWSDWTSYSTTKPSSSSNREIQSKTQYQYRDSTTTYYFYKYSDWSDWSITQPGTATGREIEQKVQYRYKKKDVPTTEAAQGTAVPFGDGKMVEDPSIEEEKAVTDNTIKKTSKKVKKGDILKGSKGTYKVTDTKKKTVTYTAPKNKKATSVTIPATIKINKKTYKVTAIADNAFKNNKKLKKVVIGKNIKTIGKNAFRGCKNLKKVSIGKNVSKIGAYAFYNCKKLKNIIVHSTKINKVGKAAFKNIAKKPTIKIKDRKNLNKYKRLFKRK